MLSFAPIAHAPIASPLYPALPAPDVPPSTRIILDPNEAAAYLVEITAFAGGRPATVGTTPIAGDVIAGTGFGGAASGEETTLRYGDRTWIGDPSDADQPNVEYEGRVNQPLVFERRMPITPEAGRRVQVGYGAVEIVNADGELDTVIRSRAVNGRLVRVLIGPPMPSEYKDFGIVAEARSVGWEEDGTTARLSLRDAGYRYQVPLQPTVYAGTGGAEGTSDLAGVSKPLSYGINRNVAAVLIDPANLIYQVHDGATEEIIAVYERGDAVTDGNTDHTDYAALAAASVTMGTFETCLAEGLFKLGSAPAGQVTADVKGDDDTTGGGGYVDTIDAIMLRLLETAGIDRDGADFSDLASGPGGAGSMGYHVPAGDQQTVAEAFDRLVGGVGGCWGQNRTNRLRGNRLTEPAGRPTSLSLTTTEIIKLDLLSLQTQPRWRQRVGFRRNWTLQSQDVPASVSASRRQEIAQPFRVVSKSDSGLQTRNLRAFDAPVLESYLDEESDAQAVCDALQSLHGQDRQLIAVAVPRQALILNLNDVVHVTWPRYGLQIGKRFATAGIIEDCGRDEHTLILWG